MRYRVLYEGRDRMRLRIPVNALTLEQADALEAKLGALPGVKRAAFHERTCNAVIEYLGDRETLLMAVERLELRSAVSTEAEDSGRALRRDYEDKLFFLLAKRYAKKLLLPLPIRTALTAVKSVRYIVEGLRCLAARRLEVPVLDATAITASMLQNDFETAGSIMFLLELGALLEEWTYRKSVADLARQMVLNVESVWRKNGGEEVLVPVDQVCEGDVIVIRTGHLIPLDGVVCAGEAMVNQSTMTGEALAVRKTAGHPVYAGTVVEEGQCEVTVSHAHGKGRYDRIVRMIEDSERLKSETESRAAHLADSLVPYSLGGTLLAYLLTGNVQKAMSVLMVDYSCALKLAMPIAVLSAMRECGSAHITVKGGKFLEAVAEAPTLVFDKTGTLTHAAPKLKQVIPFDDRGEDELLRMAACLEEHYPHSIAGAVVEAARERGLVHPERHSEIEYIVAHGIASTVDGQSVRIGSYHFLFEDEGCAVPTGQRERFAGLPEGYTYLYMSIEGRLAAVFCIEDPVRDEAAEVIAALRQLGFDRIVMMTGDGQRTASAVAVRLGLDDFCAEVLPEDKAAFIRSEHQRGRRVVMIGDGVNDSPALSEADAGIAIAAGAAIAREVADITIQTDDLRGLVLLRQISRGLMDRIERSYRRIMTVNSMLILLGFLGVLPPATTALMHNLSTILFSVQNMQSLPIDRQSLTE